MSMMLSVVVLLLATMAASPSGPIPVRLQNENGRWVLLRGGEPYTVKGVGWNGIADLARVRAYGANSIRTWGADNGRRDLDAAHAHGLTVCMGIWLGHRRHGFDYGNEAMVREQLERARRVVRELRDHPALLLWGVGNEVELDGDDPRAWRAINDVAKMIKEEDPHHPTIVVVAEIGQQKWERIRDLLPDVDIIGINTYGGIHSLPRRLTELGVTKPYIVTEHGPLGPWESPRTAWGAAVEATSTQKAVNYREGTRVTMVEDAARCLGTYAFFYGWKQETTSTWFGMALPTGEKLGALDAMSEIWTGAPPKQRSPEIVRLAFAGADSVAPGVEMTVEITMRDADDDALKAEWFLKAEATETGMGGDAEPVPERVTDPNPAAGNKVRFRAPTRPGAYRFFLKVRDGKGGAATGNLCFQVRA